MYIVQCTYMNSVPQDREEGVGKRDAKLNKAMRHCRGEAIAAKATSFQFYVVFFTLFFLWVELCTELLTKNRGSEKIHHRGREI